MENEKEPLRRVVACVIRRGSSFLLGRRPSHKRHGGLWEFPGGKCEPGESDTDTVCRELREELGVTCITRVGPLLFEHRDPGSSFLVAFISVGISDTPRASEHSEILWLSSEQIPLLNLAPSDAAFVQFMDTTGWQNPDGIQGSSIAPEKGAFSHISSLLQLAAFAMLSFCE